MNYKYISIPSDNSFDRTQAIYGVRVIKGDTSDGQAYYAYNFDLTAPSSSSDIFIYDDENGDFVVKMWMFAVKNNNSNAAVKNNKDACVTFIGDTQIEDTFNASSTNVYDIPFCQPLYLRNAGKFSPNVQDATIRDRIQFLVEDPYTIYATPSKTVLANAGETINIAVVCENAWTVTGNTWLTLSSTGDTGSTTITATAPDYSAGTSARTDTLTFSNTVTGDEAEITIKQKKYSSGQPVYLGGDEVTELYLGGNAVSEAYLGEDLVFSSGPFAGLKVSPKSLYFDSSNLTASVKVKASESWTMTTPAWISASTLSGDAGETIVTLTATAQSADTTGTIEVASANYSASTTASYALFTPVNYIHSQSMGNNTQLYITLPVNCTTNSRVRITGKGAGYGTG